MLSNASGRRGRVLVLGRRSRLVAESLGLVLRNAGVPASVVDRAETVGGFDSVAAVLVCDDDGARLLTSILFTVPDIYRDVPVVALHGVRVARADVRLPLTADRDDLLRSLGVVAPTVAGSLGRRLERLTTRRARNGLEVTARLTSRESEVVALLVEGAHNYAIAAKLNISVNTVRTHVQNILAKLGVNSRLEAAGLAAAQLRHVGMSAGTKVS